MRQEVYVPAAAPKPLSAAERAQFVRLEKVVFDDLRAFLRVGSALIEIRDRELYREDYPNCTFEGYCKKVFDISKSRAYQLIDASSVVDNLTSTNCGLSSEETIIDMLPMNEAQARPLARLQPDQQREVWQAVVRNAGAQRKVTASLVNKVVKKYLGETVKSTVRNAREEVSAGQHVSADFARAFDSFLEQIEKEKNAGYKTTSREEILSASSSAGIPMASMYFV